MAQTDPFVVRTKEKKLNDSTNRLESIGSVTQAKSSRAGCAVERSGSTAGSSARRRCFVATAGGTAGLRQDTEANAKCVVDSNGRKNGMGVS